MKAIKRDICIEIKPSNQEIPRRIKYQFNNVFVYAANATSPPIFLGEWRLSSC